jgi:hypothetical protein
MSFAAVDEGRVNWRRLCAVALALASALVLPSLARADRPAATPLGVVPHTHGAVMASPFDSMASPGFDLPPTPGAMSLHGGRVIHAATTHTIYWVPSGYGVSSDYQGLVDGFLANVAADSGTSSNVYGSDTEYSDGPTGHILYSQTFAGGIVDTDPFPSGVTSFRAECPAGPPCVTDDELFAEIDAVRAQHGLPGGLSNMYVILTPRNVNVCINWAPGVPCSTNVFCAYHTWDGLTPPGSPDLVYAVQPYYQSFSGCDPGAHPNNSDADLAINTVSHETNEMITDPTNQGWYDANFYENGDKCAWNFGTHLGATAFGDYNQVINGAHYFLQREWSNTLNGCYQVGKPTIGVITPGSAQTGDTVGITGTNFFGAGGAVTVLFNGHPSSSVLVDSSTHLSAVVPGGVSTTGHVTVQAVGGTAVSTGVFGLAPTVTGLSLSEAHAGQTVLVSGEGFFGVTSVKFNGVAASFSGVSPSGTSLTATVPAGAVSGPVSVTTTGGTSASPGDFTVDPVITSFTPTSAAVGVTVTVNGSGFGSVGQSRDVEVNGVAAGSVIWVSPNQLRFTVGSGSTTGKLSVAVDGGLVALSATNLLVPPHLTGYTGEPGRVGDAVTITGSTLDGATSVKFGTVAAVIDSNDGSSIHTHVPAGALTGTVTVVTPGGTTIGPIFHVLPTISEPFAPTHGTVGSTLTLAGQSFTGTSSVKVGGVAAAFAVLGPTSLRLTIPAAAVSGPIAVTTLGGTSTTGGSFTVDPAITSFTPTSAAVGATVTVNGSGFGSVSQTRTVQVNGTPAGTITWVSPNQLRFVVPAGATTGQIKVSVDGGVMATSALSLGVTFTVTGFSPAIAAYGDHVAITGIGLTGVTAVKFNGISGGIVSNSGAQMDVTVPASGAVSGQITVWKGIASIPAPGTFTLFSVGGIAPAIGVSGDAVTITGSGFTGATGVAFNGTAAASYTVDSDTQITANVPASATSGPVSVTDASGKTLAGPTFTVQAKLLLNEVAPAIPDGHNLVELYAKTAGTVSGIALVVDPGASDQATVVTLPDFTVAKDELVVLHLGMASPAGPTHTGSTWDLNVTGNIPYGDAVLELKRAATVLDAVPFAQPSLGDAPDTFVTSLNALGAQWTTGCTGSCDATSAPGAAVSWDGVGTDPDGMTVQRAYTNGHAVDTNDASDWSLAGGTIGSQNT